MISEWSVCAIVTVLIDAYKATFQNHLFAECEICSYFVLYKTINKFPEATIYECYSVYGIKPALTLHWPGCTYRVHTFHKLCPAVNQAPNSRGDTGHDAHTQHHVAEVCHLDANLGQRTANGTHAEWEHVHIAT